MADIAPEEQGSLETRADAGAGEAGEVKLWLDALAIADKAEADWRERADRVVKLYRDAEAEKKDRGEKSRFNILYANVETLKPAVYNSTPKPDVRRRFNDTDPPSRIASQVIERAVNVQIDGCDFDDEMKAAVEDMLLPGRGVTRVRYEPVNGEDGQIASQSLKIEHVPWFDFRVGPARRWSGVPWVAFRQYLTREQLVGLNKELGQTIPLDCTTDGKKRTDADEPVPDVFKRAEVWEIWDKDTRQVVFIAPGYKDRPILKQADDYRLEHFFPIPRPLYAVRTSSTLVPVEEFRIYRDQAEELDQITTRIRKLIKVLKWRGVRDISVDGFDTMQDADDGELVASENVYKFAQAGGGLDKAIWLMPIEEVSKVLAGLYQQREQIKQTIYEVMGVADIMRGATQASETLGAQQLKAQWGSLRIQDRQSEVQRYARDLIRIFAELICEHFDPALLSAMTGIQVDQTVMQIIQSDVMRSFRVDIETDSTIQADVQRSQQNMAQFVQGFGTFVQAIGPAVQAGVVPMDAATDILTAFSRVFKLGRQAEDALERIGGAKGPDGQPVEGQKPPQESPQQQAAAAEASAKQQAQAADLQAKQQAQQLDLQHKDAAHQQAMAHKEQQFQLDQKLKRVGANNDQSAELGLEPDDQDPKMGIAALAQGQVVIQQAIAALAQSAAGMQQALAHIAGGQQQILQATMAPKQSEIIWKNGRPAGSISRPMVN